MMTPDHLSRSNLSKFLLAAQRMRNRIAESLERVGLSTAEYDVLGQLDGGAWRSAQDLRAPILEQLATRGLVQRAGHGAGRSGVARITATGRSMLEDALRQVDIARTAFLTALTPVECRELARLLARFP